MPPSADPAAGERGEPVDVVPSGQWPIAGGQVSRNGRAAASAPLPSAETAPIYRPDAKGRLVTLVAAKQTVVAGKLPKRAP